VAALHLRAPAVTHSGAGLDDDRSDTDAQPDATIGESQQADLRALVLETAANEVKFLAFMGVESYAEIRAADYARAVAALEARRRKR
jgi:hypothetical protein